MLMQQVREVMTVNQEMTDELSWIWLTSEQMGFPLWSEYQSHSVTLACVDRDSRQSRLGLTC